MVIKRWNRKVLEWFCFTILFIIMGKKIIWHGERPIEFEYLYSDWNFFVKESFTLDEIANWDPQDYFPPILKDYVVIAKRQRTGLHDKNWTKIYEGDIIDLDAPNNWGSYWEVVNHEWCRKFRRTRQECVHQAKQEYTTKEYYTLLWQRWWQCFVIWNIYQNANLLSE